MCYIGIDGRPPEIIASYMDHGSLVYGADWCRSCVNELPELPADYDCDTLAVDSDSPQSETVLKSSCRRVSKSSLTVDKTDQLIASCSFYDHQLRISALTRDVSCH